MKVDADFIKTVLSVIAVLGGVLLIALKIINRLVNGKNGDKVKPGEAQVCRDHEKAIIKLGTLMEVVRDETIPTLEKNLKDHLDLKFAALEKSINGGRRHK